MDFRKNDRIVKDKRRSKKRKDSHDVNLWYHKMSIIEKLQKAELQKKDRG